MNNKIAAVGMAAALGIGTWIAHPHSSPPTQPDPNWSVNVTPSGTIWGYGKDTLSCAWEKNGDKSAAGVQVKILPNPKDADWLTLQLVLNQAAFVDLGASV